MKFVDRNPQRSPEEIEFDRLCREYYERFGKQYVIQMFLGPDQWNEINVAIRKCLETGKPQKMESYTEELVY